MPSERARCGRRGRRSVKTPSCDRDFELAADFGVRSASMPRRGASPRTPRTSARCAGSAATRTRGHRGNPASTAKCCSPRRSSSPTTSSGRRSAKRSVKSPIALVDDGAAVARAGRRVDRVERAQIGARAGRRSSRDRAATVSISVTDSALGRARRGGFGAGPRRPAAAASGASSRARQVEVSRRRARALRSSAPRPRPRRAAARSARRRSARRATLGRAASAITSGAPSACAKSWADRPMRRSGRSRPSACRIGRLSQGSARVSGGQSPSTSPPSTTRSTVCRRASSAPKMRTRASGLARPQPGRRRSRHGTARDSRRRGSRCGCRPRCRRTPRPSSSATPPSAPITFAMRRRDARQRLRRGGERFQRRQRVA